MPQRSNAFPLALLPQITGLRLEQVQLIERTLILSVRTTDSCADSPQCRHPSFSIHSYYTRKLADLPWSGYAVQLFLHVRKFFCRNVLCAQRIFTERLPSLVEPHARRTTRLQDILTMIAFALGGEAGARLASRLSMPISPATLIAMIRQTPLPPSSTPRVLGVDDWVRPVPSKQAAA